jgi:hypothetical protein
MEVKLKNLLDYVKADGRICPNPQEWNELWEMLSDKQLTGSSTRPPVPLILGAWNYASNISKIIRLAEQINYAAKYGKLDEIDTYLRGLKSEQWFRIKPNTNSLHSQKSKS